MTAAIRLYIGLLIVLAIAQGREWLTWPVPLLVGAGAWFAVYVQSKGEA